MMPSYRFLGIDLSHGVQKRHMAAYLLAAFISSGYAGALAVLQPGLLATMAIDHSQQALITGNLSALQEVVFILLMGTMGALSDRIGRRSVYAFGLFFTAVGFTLYPFASSISELMLYRLVVAIGGAAMVGMMVTVIADYSQDHTRGHANGVQGFIATLGAFIPPLLAVLPKIFVEQGHPEAVAQQLTFAIGGSLGIVASLVALFGLAPHVRPAATQAQESIAKLLRVGLGAVKDPQIALSYGAAFISRGDLAITGAFMSLWLVQYGTAELGMTPSEAMFELAVPRTLAIVSGAVIGSLLMGKIADRISRVSAVCVASGMAALVYLGVFFVSDPTEGWVMVLLLFMGIAEISAFVSSQALVGQQAEPQRRGAIIGFFGVAGAIGILVATAGGGWLYSRYGPSTPFVLFGALNAVVFVWSMALRPKLERIQAARAEA